MSRRPSNASRQSAGRATAPGTVPAADPSGPDENPFESVDVPQADVLERIIVLVRLIAGGDPVTADALGVGARNVSYYFAAARMLHLLDVERRLLPAGRALASLDARLQPARLSLAFEYSACCQEWLRQAGAGSIEELTKASAEEFLRASGRVTGTTIGRRAVTLARWLSLFWMHHPFRRQRPLPFAAPGTALPGPDTPHFDRGGAVAAVDRLAPGTRAMRIATAYFTVPGYELLARHLTGATIQLLVGTPEAEDQIDVVLAAFKRSIEQGQPTKEKRVAVRRFYEELVSGSLRVRHIEARLFRLHAKVFLFDDRAALVGSANFTGSGLKSNVEAGYVSRDSEHVRYYTGRFDEYFGKAKEIIDQLLPTLERSWLFAPAPPPWILYLRVLLEIYEANASTPPTSSFTLARYQEMIVGSVLRALVDHRGVMLISPTGTGKTVMAAYVAACLFPGTITRVVLVPPNDNLARKWVQHFRSFGLSVDVLKHGRLQGKGQRDGGVDEEMKSIAENLRPTDLLVVDESHAFRNDESKGFGALEALLAGSPASRPWCLLLTATPISTGMRDLNHQLGLIGAQPIDSADAIAEASQIVNITLPLIVRSFGSAAGQGRSRSLAFGEERRYFPNIRFRTVRYRSELETLLPVIRGMDLRIRRADAKAVKEILHAVDEGSGAASANALLRVVLARLAESSVHALSQGLARLRMRLGAQKIIPQDEGEFTRGLDELERAVGAITSDSKLENLLTELHERPGRTLIFTSFTDTAEYLCRELAERFPKRRIELVTGAVLPKKRAEILKRFAPVAHGGDRRRRKTDLDLLVCTDAISEGVDLQDATALINYDLHWTPLRLIQRVGRVDRATKLERDVEVMNFYPGDTTFEELLGLWQRLEARAGTYEVFAKTTVLRDHDRNLSELSEPESAGIAAVYNQTDYLTLLEQLPPSTNHLTQLFEATEGEVEQARALAVGTRSARLATRDATFALFRSGALRGAALRDEVAGTVSFAPSRLEQPGGFPYEYLLHSIRPSREEATAALPDDLDKRLSEISDAWAARVGVDKTEVTIVCALALVSRRDRTPEGRTDEAQ